MTCHSERSEESPRSRRLARRRRQAGVIGLTDVLLGIGVAAIALPAIVAVANQQAQETQDQVAAHQLKAIGEAVPAYIKDHFATVYQNIGSGGGDFLTVAALINTGYLPVNFNEQNNFKQRQVVLLRRVAQDSGACAALPATPPACKQLIEALIVTTGGTALDPARASHIAVLSGAHAGIMVDGGTARGSYNTWCEDLRLFGGSTPTTCPATDTRPHTSDALSNAAYTYGPPAKGGLASAMFFNGGEMISEYLNRFNTGNPEDNTMHTDIDMGDDSLVNVKTVQIAGVTQPFDANRMTMVNDLYAGNYTANGGNLNIGPPNGGTITAKTFADAVSPSQFFVTPAGTSQIQAVVASGTVTGAAFYHLSDATLKTNVRPIEEPIGLVNRLTGHRFDWKADGAPDVGFIAQEVRQVLPEAVGRREDGKLAVKYDVLAAPLVEAVKELVQRVDQLEADKRRLAAERAAGPRDNSQ